MKEEEKKLLERCGKNNPFTVPEGYFEHFTDKLMEQLPENKPQELPEVGMWQRVKPWVYMAAMFCGLMFSVRIFMGDKHRSQSDSASGAVELTEYSDEYIDPIVKQTMMDDYTLYQYLTSAGTDFYE